MTDEIHLRQIAASMLINCHFDIVGSISDQVEQITAKLTTIMDDNNIEYDKQDIELAIIDSLAIALRMKRGI